MYIPYTVESTYTMQYTYKSTYFDTVESIYAIEYTYKSTYTVESTYTR